MEDEEMEDPSQTESESDIEVCSYLKLGKATLRESVVLLSQTWVFDVTNTNHIKLAHVFKI